MNPNNDEAVKIPIATGDGLWKKVDICPAGNALGVRGVVSCTTIRQYIWYGELSCKTYNEVDRAFYESINNDDLVKSQLRLPQSR